MKPNPAFARRHFSTYCVIATAALAAAAPLAARAQTTFTWTHNFSGNASGSWSVLQNWNGVLGPVANGAGNIADFSTLDISTTSTVVLDGDRTIGTLRFGDTNTTTPAGWILAPGSPAGSKLTLSSPLGTPTITVNPLGTNATASITAALGGTQGFVKDGGGTLMFGAAPGTSTLAGDVSVNAGTLTLGQNDQIPDVSNVTVRNGASFNANGRHENFANLTLYGAFSTGPAAAVTVADTITVNPGGNLSLGPGTNVISASRLVINSSAVGVAGNQVNPITPNTSLTLAGGTFSVSAPVAILSPPGVAAQTFGGTQFSLNPGGSTLAIQNDRLPGVGGGSGISSTLTLPDTWVRTPGASLFINFNPNGAGGAATVVSSPLPPVANPGPTTPVLGYAWARYAQLGGTAGFAYVDGSGHVVPYTAATVLPISAGPNITMDPSTNYTLSLDSDAQLNPSTLTANSLMIDLPFSRNVATVDLGGNTVSVATGGLIVSNTFSTGRIITLDNGKLGAPNAELLLHKNGGGNLVLGPNLTLSGGTGSVVLDGDNSGSFIVIENNTSTFSGGFRLHQGATLGVSASSVSSGGTLVSGPFGTGTLTLGGGRLYASFADIRVDNPVNFESDTWFPFTPLTFGGPTTLTRGSHVIQGSATFAGPIGDGGGGYGLTVTRGTVVLGGANTYTGLTRLNGASLLVNGSIPGSVDVDPGSTLGGAGNIGGNATFGSTTTLAPGNNGVGKLTVNGNLTLSPSTSSQFEVGGSSNSDRVTVGGSATIAGTLSVSLVNGFTPTFGDTFHILTAAGGRAGTFAGNGRVSPSGVTLLVSYSPTDVVLTAPLPGDLNLDGVVGGGDFNLLASNFGKSGQTWFTGDITGDGVVGAGDFNILAANFGRSVSGSTSNLTAADWAALQDFDATIAPEPSTATLALVCLGPSLLRRRRRRVA